MRKVENEALRSILAVLTDKPCRATDAISMAGVGRSRGLYVIKKAVYSGEIKVTNYKDPKGTLRELISRKTPGGGV